MRFVARLKHSPDNCWAREENAKKAREWIAETESEAERLGVELHGAYVTPNEHTFYFVVEADDFSAVSEFFGPPLLQDHEGDIAPVIPFEEVEDLLPRSD